MRQAHHSDIEFLKKLQCSTMNEYLKELDLPTDNDTNLKQIKNHFKAANILSIYNKPIGVFKYYQGSKTWHIEQIQLLPEYQGKRICESILKEFQKSVAINLKPINVNVLKSNPDKRYYEELGFCVVSQNDNEFMMQYDGSK